MGHIFLKKTGRFDPLKKQREHMNMAGSMEPACKACMLVMSKCSRRSDQYPWNDNDFGEQQNRL